MIILTKNLPPKIRLIFFLSNLWVKYSLNFDENNSQNQTISEYLLLKIWTYQFAENMRIKKCFPFLFGVLQIAIECKWHKCKNDQFFKKSIKKTNDVKCAKKRHLWNLPCKKLCKVLTPSKAEKNVSHQLKFGKQKFWYRKKQQNWKFWFW